jgi:hypothetical protein
LEAFVFELFVLALALWIATCCDFDRIGIWRHPLIQFFLSLPEWKLLVSTGGLSFSMFIYLGAGISLRDWPI